MNADQNIILETIFFLISKPKVDLKNKLKEILSTYYEKYLRIKSKDANKEKYLIDLLSNKPIGNKYITELTGSVLARFRDHELHFRAHVIFRIH